MAAPEAKPLCTTPPQPPLALPASMPRGRRRALMVGASKWVNGTVLRYAFFDGETNPAWAPVGEAQLAAVRQAFEDWKETGIGLDFEEVEELDEAEVRIGFDQGDDSWSAIGRDVLGVGVNERTMNLAEDPTTPYGRTTALHEIGHTLGMPHEHQSPFSGIVWDTQAVYTYFAGPPNEWTHRETDENVLEKLDPAQVEGSEWDPESIMEYIIESGLILEPVAYQGGINPPGTISTLDIQWMTTWYPGLFAQPKKIDAFKSVPLSLAAKQQADFAISPPASRTYEIGTFGSGDTVAVLFEKVDGKLRYVSGDDDGGEDRNARLNLKLLKGREYVLRVRVVWAGQSGETAVMYW